LFDPTWGKNYLDELRWVDEVISPVRNAQVLLDRFSGYSDAIKNRNDQFSKVLQEDLKKCQTQLQRDLTLPIFRQFLSNQNFETQDSLHCIHSNELVINYLKHFNATAWETLTKAAVKADEDQLHMVRIKAKKVKYLAEASIPVIGNSLKKHAKIASKMQRNLGYLQDSIMMTAVSNSPEVLEYEKKQRKQIKNDWRKFVKRNF
jgi:CHAD domain-containing protein